MGRQVMLAARRGGIAGESAVEGIVVRAGAGKGAGVGDVAGKVEMRGMGLWARGSVESVVVMYGERAGTNVRVGPDAAVQAVLLGAEADAGAAGLLAGVLLAASLTWAEASVAALELCAARRGLGTSWALKLRGSPPARGEGDRPALRCEPAASPAR